jgi:hypothetical protein
VVSHVLFCEFNALIVVNVFPVVSNDAGGNCFHLIYKQTTGPKTGIDPFNQYCNYFGVFGTAELTNTVLSAICQTFAPFGCCWANQVSMLSQDQTNKSAVRLFPPCLMNYLTLACNSTFTAKDNKNMSVSQSVPCTKGLGTCCTIRGIKSIVIVSYRW